MDQLCLQFCLFHFYFWVWLIIAVKLSLTDTVNKSTFESLTSWSFSFKRKSLIILIFQFWRQAFTRFRLVDNEVSSVVLWKQLCLSVAIDETAWMFWDTATTPKPSVNQTCSQAGLALFWAQNLSAGEKHGIQFLCIPLWFPHSRRRASVYTAPHDLWGVTECNRETHKLKMVYRCSTPMILVLDWFVLISYTNWF